MDAAINVVCIASLQIPRYRTSCTCSGPLGVNSERGTWFAKSARGLHSGDFRSWKSSIFGGAMSLLDTSHAYSQNRPLAPIATVISPSVRFTATIRRITPSCAPACAQFSTATARRRRRHGTK